ncbi:hypothetical protein [Thermogemmatispora sp.]|uniref:hypothetical protein n=1 Tax=Thermogemmatispora sp. TaxID=1968838 RepID=UPI001D401633|nr:hypothetical protein [Thermogemmatispora sp.]MBX5451986.1 hypothetical protein [Thermogemmatispora sp.]
MIAAGLRLNVMRCANLFVQAALEGEIGGAIAADLTGTGFGKRMGVTRVAGDEDGQSVPGVVCEQLPASSIVDHNPMSGGSATHMEADNLVTRCITDDFALCEFQFAVHVSSDAMHGPY